MGGSHLETLFENYLKFTVLQWYRSWDSRIFQQWEVVEGACDGENVTVNGKETERTEEGGLKLPAED